jgi:Flp pilus assembly protein protease CpaA
MLALQAFWLTLVVSLVAIVATLFIRSRPQPIIASADGRPQSEEEEDREALLNAIIIE